MTDIADQQEINRLNALVEALVKERDELKEWQGKMTGLVKQDVRAEAAEAQAAKLKEALKFYADATNSDDVTVPDFYDELDFGEIARRALEEGK